MNKRDWRSRLTSEERKAIKLIDSQAKVLDWQRSLLTRKRTVIQNRATQRAAYKPRAKK
jgi:hypothetical protein